LNPQVVGSSPVAPSGVCARQRLGRALVICRNRPWAVACGTFVAHRDCAVPAHRDRSTACSMYSSSIPLAPDGVVVTVTATGATRGFALRFSRLPIA